MNKADLIKGLRGLADELKPFTQEVRFGVLVCDGTAYVQAEPKQADTYALMWWSTLNSIADLLDTQDTLLSAEQITHLRQQLIGGMGSFTDYCIDMRNVAGMQRRQPISASTNDDLSCLKSLDNLSRAG